MRILFHFITYDVILFIIISFLRFHSYPSSSFSFVYDVMKPQFQNNFNSKCLKYPFVQNHYERLHNPTGQVITFVFQQPGLRNGGLGDRLAGLVNAVAMSARFNRSLIIRAENDFYKLFRPYIPPEYEEQDKDKFTYNRSQLSWAKYNSSYENNDDTELDLWNCININGNVGPTCSQMNGNPGQPNILLRGNRAYLCRWYNAGQDHPAKLDLIKMIGSRTGSPLELENDDLMEVAGCMLRLAMWPTDFFWTLVEEAIQSHKLDLKRRGLISHHDSASLWRNMVSLHFRCGDLSYIHGKSFEDACKHSYTYNITTGNVTKEIYNLPPHRESDYMKYGTPIDLAKCAKKILENMTFSSNISWKEFLEQEKAIIKSITTNNINNSNNNNNFTIININRNRYQRKMTELLNMIHTDDISLEFRTILHIASDNVGSSQQINETLQWPNTLMSPSGCHIEMDTSFQCLRLTTVYWFIMALSDYIVSPGTLVDSTYIPNSGFSKFAAIYGLKNNSLYDPNHCDLVSLRNLSHRQHGSWNCM